MIKIILEGERELELTGDESISLNYHISSVSDFTKKLGSYSKTIQIFGSKSNNDILLHYWNLGSDEETTFNPNIKVKATISVDTTVLFYGYIQLNKIKRNLDQSTIYYEITFYSDLNRFIKDRVGKYISEITSLTAFTHDYTWVNINSTWDNPKGYGYMYPFVDRNRNYNISYISQATTATTVNMSEYYPAMYVKSIWDGIMEDAGYTYDFPFAHEDLFKSLVFTTDKLSHSDEFIKENEYKAVLNSGWTIDSSGIPEYFFGTLNFQDDNLYGYDVGNHYNTSNGEYTFTERIKAGFDISLNFSSTFAGEIELRLMKNNLQIWNGHFRNVTVNNNPPNMPNTEPFSVQIPEFQFVPGDVISVYMGYYSNNIATINTGSFIRMNVNTAIMPGDQIDFSQILPKISQVDFFHSIVKMFNLYVEPSKDFENELMIRSKDEYYEGQGIVDWSDRLDISRQIQIKPLSELQAKTIRFSWLEDTDYLNKYYFDRWNEIFGQNETIIENDYLSIGSVQEVKPVFSPTIMGNVIGSTTMQIPKVFSVDETTGLFKKGNNKPKIFFFNSKLSCEKYYVRSDNGAMYATINFPYCSTLYGDIANPEFDLNWGTPRQIFVNLSGQTTYPDSNLVSEYYQNTLEEIISSKLVTCYMHLTHADISQLNFRKQVYVNIDGGHYFKLISIQDFDPTTNGICKVELLQSLNINQRPTRTRDVVYRPNGEAHNTTRLINQLNIGTENQILTNNNMVVGRGNTVNDLSVNNIINGDNNEIKAGVLNSFISGKNNIVSETNTNIIGGSGNTSTIGNSTIINSFNVGIITGGTTSNTYSNISVLSSDNISISGKSNIVILGLNKQSNFNYSSHTYTNGLSILELTGTTTNVAGIQSDGKVIILPFSAITSGITTGGDSYWTAGTLTNDLIRANSNNDANAGDTIILHGIDNSGYTPNSVIFGSKNIAYGSYFAPYSMFTGIYGLNNIGGAKNTIYGSINNIHNGFYNLINNGVYNTISNGLNNKLYTSSLSFINGASNQIYSNSFGTIFGNSNRIFSGTGNNFNFIAGSTNHITGAYNSILCGKLSRITGSTSTILNGDGNYIIGNRNTILNGFNNRINQFATNSSIINGQDNNINNGDGNLIVNGKRNTLNNVTGVTIMGFDDYTESSENNILITKNAKITSLTGATIQMVVADTSGKLGVQTIPSGTGGTYTQYWTVGGVASALIQNNGYTTANSIFSIVAGKTNIIGASSDYSTILGGLQNQNSNTSKYSVTLNGYRNNIKSNSDFSFLATGKYSYIKDSIKSSIINGHRNQIYNNNVVEESKYNSIINGNANIINRAYHCAILGGYANGILGTEDEAFKYNVIFGKQNYIQANYSAIIGGQGYFLSENNTLMTPKLKIGNLPVLSSSYLLNANSSGNVCKIALSGGTGIKIDNSSGLLTLTYTGSTSGGGATINNGINTFTAGTSSFQSVNVTALTINTLSASGNSIVSANFSASTIFSGANNLNILFSPTGHTHQFSTILNTAHTHTVSDVSNLSNLLNTKLNLSGGTMTGGLITTSLSATTLSGGTIYSGSTDLSSLFATSTQITNAQTFVQPGTNTYTGGTSLRPTVNVSALTINTLFASGNTILSSMTASTLTVNSLSGGGTQMVVSDNSGNLSVQAIPAAGQSTVIRNGLNTYTAGTTADYTVNVSALTINTLSASGTTTLNSITGTTTKMVVVNSAGTLSSKSIQNSFQNYKQSTLPSNSTKRYYRNSPINGGTANGTLAANTIVLTPFYVAKDCQIDEMMINITTTGSGIYSIATYDNYSEGGLFPGNLKQNFGTGVTTVSGVKIITASTASDYISGMYWLAIWNSASFAITINSNNSIDIGTTSSNFTNPSSFTSAATYSNTWPAQMSGVTSVNTVAPLMQYHMKTIYN